MANNKELTTIAGSLVGLDDNQFVVVDKKTDNTETVMVHNRWFYCKKCQRDAEKDGIFLAERSRNDTLFLVVLAIGIKCGRDQRKELRQFELKEKMQLPDWLPQANLGVEVFDRILCPEDHLWGITRSPYCPNDYFIHECIAKANFGKAEEIQDVRNTSD